jgi:hypothetical protein
MGDVRVKVFQVFFGRDGSLFINFPYLRNRIGILSASAIPGDGLNTTQVNLEPGGKVTSHLVKYSHHPDGRAHFSQTGKIHTAIKRQSIALNKQNGHILSLQFQGLSALEPADPMKDVGTSPKRSIVDFEAEPSDAIKFVGRWYDVNNIRVSEPTPTVGPIVPMLHADGIRRLGCFMASPHANARHVLLVGCQPIPKLNPDSDTFIFVGGFDPHDTMFDTRKDAGFLAFMYPILEPDQLRNRIGSVDYVPKL